MDKKYRFPGFGLWSIVAACLALTAGVTFGTPPEWWFETGDDSQTVVDPVAPAENPKGPANIGQAKFMAKRALETLKGLDPILAGEIEAKLTVAQPKLSAPGGFHPPVLDFSIPDPKPSGWDAQQRAPLLIGQLKAISAPFYDALHSSAPSWLDHESSTEAGKGQLQLNETKDPLDAGNYYPWSSATADDQNLAVATIGQLKAVFSLRFETFPTYFVDLDEDGMDDVWEIAHDLNPDDAGDAYEDADGDGVVNLSEYLLGFDPNDETTASGVEDSSRDRDGDGMPDSWEASWGSYQWDAGSVSYVFVRVLDWDTADGTGDLDGDGLDNLGEHQAATAPNDYDSDDDSMSDGWESANDLDPNDPWDARTDPDGDDLVNWQEHLLGFDPNDETTNGTSDKTKDRDSDGMPDAWEILWGDSGWNGDPVLFLPLLDWEVNDAAGDPDEDALSNLREFQEQTSPGRFDSDFDALPDGWEADHPPLDANEWNNRFEDPDSDGVPDYFEYLLGFDPHDATTYGTPDAQRDRDSDGMPDYWEALSGVFQYDSGLQREVFVRGLDWDVNDAAGDLDGDGSSNLTEYQEETGVNVIDSDYDRLPDGWERQHGLDPRDSYDDNGTDGDPDGDNVPNQAEYLLGFDPQDATTNGIADHGKDRDADGMPDWWEASFVSYEWDGQAGHYVFTRRLDWTIADGTLDLDNDGLSNLEEFQEETDPTFPDTDMDFLPDGWEDQHGLDPNSASGDDGPWGDPDSDGIENQYEYVLGFDPNDATTFGTPDNTRDRDGDAMPDGWEAATGAFIWIDHEHGFEFIKGLDWETSDAGTDLDGDGMTNLLELGAGTGPNEFDSDGDGLPDGFEYNSIHLDPLAYDDPDADSDGDGMSNLFEAIHGFDPDVNESTLDPDGDGLTNAQEVIFGSDPTNADIDNDGLDDSEEQQHGTDPWLSDTDSDNLPDKWELDHTLDPTVADDQDGDGDSDNLGLYQEYRHNTDPANPDTDGDGSTDGAEVAAGTDPTDPDWGGTPPAAPSNVNVTLNGGGGFTVTWTDNSTNERGFHIYILQPDNTWLLVGSVAEDITTFTNP